MCLTGHGEAMAVTPSMRGVNVDEQGGAKGLGRLIRSAIGYNTVGPLHMQVIQRSMVEAVYIGRHRETE